MANKNYYMQQSIGADGIAPVYNPARIQTSPHGAFTNAPAGLNVGQYFNNNTIDSKYTEDLGDVSASIRAGRTVEDLLAEKQSGWEMLGNALVNNAVIAGTTAISGTVGIVDGIIEAIANQDVSKVWDNSINNWAVDVQDATREALPIYRGQEYQNQSIWDKMGTGIFWADLIQNLGFTEGMLIPGMGAASLLKSLPAMARGVAGAAISAIGEGSIEAINERNEEVANKTELARQRYNEMVNNVTTQGEFEELNDSYNEAVSTIEEDANNSGNFTFGANIALLTLTNTVEFGNLFSRGFSTARKTSRALRRTAEGLAAESLGKDMAGTTGRKLLNAFSEGMEEVSQKAISSTAQYYDDYNKFNESIFNPEKRELVGNLISALGKSYAETLNDPQTAEEFAMGFITGIVGVPTLRKAAIPIGIENNIAVDLYQTYKNNQREQNLAEEINNKLANSKEFNAYYDGVVRHLAIQDDINASIDEDDKLAYNTARAAQLISDVRMFHEAGHIDYLKELINNSVDLSDEGIDAIIDATTVNGEGPFVNNGNKLDRDTVRRLIKEKQQTINNKIDFFVKNKELLEAAYPEADDDTINNAIFLKSQIEDHTDRYSSLKEEAYEGVKKLFDSVSRKPVPNKKGEYIYVKDEKGRRHRVNRADIDYIDSTGKPVMKKDTGNQNSSMSKSISTIQEFEESLNNPLFREVVNSALNSKESTMPFDEREQLAKSINDLDKLYGSIVKMNNSLIDILVNPNKSSQDKEATLENAQKKIEMKDKEEAKNALTSATSIKEFRDRVNSIEDTLLRDNVLSELDAENNPMYSNYKEVELYNSEVRRVLSEQTDDSALGDALKLLEDQYNNAETLEQIANPNSVFITNENAFDEDSASAEEAADRFINAQYAVQSAMSTVNNDLAFRDRFSAEYKRPAKKIDNADPAKGTDKGDTGADGTPSLPPVSGGETPTMVAAPTGDISLEEMREDNSDINKNAIKEEKGSRKYYRPAIPRLHIDASREGDFRPFNVVVKEKEPSVNFDAIYNYLEEKGAFDYVDEGNLHVGEEIGFIIDPVYEERVKDEPWHKEPTIFLATKEGQIIGSLDDGKSVSNFEGLASLEERLRKEYKETGKITQTTKISKIIPGKIPYTKEEHNLATIPNVTDAANSPIFGIIKNGELTTNGAVDDSLILKPRDMAGKEGRLYLLVPNGAGKYTPVAVRVKHFNSEEYSAEIKNSAIGKDIEAAFTEMSKASSQDDISKVMQSLLNDIYLEDVMLTWFDDNRGIGVTISRKLRNPDRSYKMIDIKGVQHIEEAKTDVLFATKEPTATLFDDFELDPETAKKSGIEYPSTPVDQNVIRDELIKAFMDFNLPIQVRVGNINNGGYNNRIINSGILTSNISSAKVLGSWFTTDYFDNEGHLHEAENPSYPIKSINSSETPVGGTESAIIGTRVNINGAEAVVDLENSTITINGKTRGLQAEDELFVDMAWAQNTFGDAKVGPQMVNNCVVTNSGKVLDRTNGKYLNDTEAQKVKDQITKRNSEIVERRNRAEKVKNTIYADQLKVDKERTDDKYYYILEEDGEYHAYERVHTVLGNNWIDGLTSKQQEALNQIQAKLSQLADDIQQYNNYLKWITNKYSNVDLTAYQDKTDLKDRQAIVNVVRDAMLGTKSQRALDAGTSVDRIIRDFFTLKDVSKIVKPDNISQSAFIELLETLNTIKEAMKEKEQFLTDNIVLYHKYPNGKRVAGEVDILAIDENGNFKIYDVKTGKYSFYPINVRGRQTSYFENASASQRMSNKEYYTLQLSAYKNLFESKYGLPVTQLGIMPFVLTYDSTNSNTVAKITKEKGIQITYNSSVTIPLNGPVAPVVVSKKEPIFVSTLPAEQSIDAEYSIEGSSQGTFVLDGKVTSAYLKPIIKVGDIQVYLTKSPNMTKGFSKDAQAHVGSWNYHIVMPNGQSVTVMQNSTKDTDMQAEQKIINAINGKPERIKEEAAKKTVLTESMPQPKNETAATILQSGTQQGASNFAQKEARVKQGEDAKRRRPKLRQTDSERPIWDKDKELKWLDKVLPQLSREERVHIQKGLIRVAENGPAAWGMFDNGVITLSDIAAEGTVYHEAFHVVFNLLLDPQERAKLFDEARKKFGNKSELELEEDMAEGFREYIMSQDTRGFGRKILDFFRELFDKVTNWKFVRPSLNSYYRAISQGRYSTTNIIESDLKETKYRRVDSIWSTITSEEKDMLSKKGWTEKLFNSVSQREREQALKCAHW